MVQFFARNRAGMPPPPLTTPLPPTTGGTGTAGTQNATVPGALQGLTPTGGTVATRQSQRPRMNLLGRTGNAQAQAQTPAVLPDIATAMGQAHGAHGQVAARVDGEASANAALNKRQQSIQDLQQRGTAAAAAAVAEAPRRQAELTSAQAQAQQTAAALPHLQTEVNRHEGLLNAARAQVPVLDAAVHAARNDPAPRKGEDEPEQRRARAAARAGALRQIRRRRHSPPLRGPGPRHPPARNGSRRRRRTGTTPTRPFSS